MVLKSGCLPLQVECQVLTPGEKGYEQSIERWAGNAKRKAAFVVLVDSAQDISSTVSIAIVN
jgi:hypothetical protein